MTLFPVGATLRIVVIALVVVSAQARVLPQFNALDNARPAGEALQAARIGAVAETHTEERLGLTNFVTFRPSTASTAESLAAMATGPEAAARRHLKSVANLYRASAGDVDAALLHHVEPLYNGAQIVKFTAAVDGVEIFRETATVLMDSNMQALAINGYLGATPAGSSSTSSLSASTAAPSFQLTPQQAIATALADYGFTPGVSNSVARLTQNGKSIALKASVSSAEPANPYDYFTLPPDIVGADGARMAEPARVKPVWFRLPTGLVPGYYIELQMADRGASASDYFSYVIAADDGRLLFRNDLSADVAFTYRVWAESGGINLPLPGPTGRNAFPHPTGNNDGFQAAFIPPNDITLQNGPISTNDHWLSPTATMTIGNNVEAWANLSAPAAVPPATTPPADVFEAAAHECTMNVSEPGDFHACISGANAFQYTYDTSLGAQANKFQSVAAVVNLFYLNNWLHDWYYDAGFKEINGNAQDSNYGRGGFGNDSIKAQGQDVSDFNNANMSTPSDGARPRMRMYIFKGAGAAIVSAASLNSTAGTAGFGPSNFSLSGPMVLANDGVDPTSDACETLTPPLVPPPPPPLTGKIVIIDRGGCNFKFKAVNAQTAGAIGVIIVNNVSPGVSGMSDDGTADVVTIPILMVSQADGATMKAALPANATLRRVSSGVDRDGTIENTIIAHEWGHYISNRLINDANGITASQSRGLGEGWADFHAMLLEVKAQDLQVAANANFNGVYALASYVFDGPQIAGLTFSNAYYYGIRRYPYSTDMSKNPLTFKHIQTSVALPSTPPPSSTGDNAEVHNTGEVWASMLWGCYASLLRDSARLTFAQAQDRMKRYLVAAYKLTPTDPTLIEARDALFVAIGANDATDLQLCKQAFAVRGAGASALSGARNSSTNAGVVESFSANLSVPALTRRGGIDIDGQGKSQIVVRNAVGQLQAGRLVNNALVFTAIPGADPGTGYRILGAGDLAGDGKSDLFFQDIATPGDFGDASTFLDFNPASQRLLRTVKHVWDVQAIGDLDGDGFGDLVWRYVVADSPDTGVSYIWFTGGGGVTSGSNVTQVRKRGGAPLDWKLLGAQDLNGDGAADMLYLSPASQLRVLMATPGRTCANLSAGTVPSGYNVLKFADFTGGGRGDLLVQDPLTAIFKLISLDARGLSLPPYAGAPDDPNASCT
ncbi:MAG: M36 family metallopeptidase, partial [Betaproteobacteria bacterium]|nr:M36 family metallopeptidase [Betaproteobacteria bacterium]